MALRLHNSREDDYKVEIAIICALTIEYNATKANLCQILRESSSTDRIPYALGIVGEHYIILAYMPNLGRDTQPLLPHGFGALPQIFNSGSWSGFVVRFLDQKMGYGGATGRFKMTICKRIYSQGYPGRQPWSRCAPDRPFLYQMQGWDRQEIHRLSTDRNYYAKEDTASDIDTD
ncbi:hypothetical protein N7507_010774 [Penicillium longicatenatum]|nr:hypothetical protein N7507_010774 [Penicillium longicatenatum]